MADRRNAQTTTPHPRTAPRPQPRAHARQAEQASQQASQQAAPAHPAEAPRGTRPRSRYIPALDGIRTFAVVAVVLYHLNLTWAQGGLIGVTIFFVLSGYLITRLLLVEFGGTHRIDLKSFWIRRVRRLVPAIVTVVAVTAVLCTVFNHVMLTKMRPDIVPSLLFFNNWWQILRNVSYFDALGDPSPLTHFWSLAIEEQFYLIWPPVLYLLLRLGIKHRALRRIVIVLAAVSAGAMWLLYNPAQDPSRLYYGTDTRAFSLLLGAWLAFIPERRMHPAALADTIGLTRLVRAVRSRVGGGKSEPQDEPRNALRKLPAPVAAALGFGRRHAFDLIGLVGLVGLVAMVALTNGYTAFPYQGGTLLCSLLTLMLIIAAVQPDGIIVRFFSLAPLVWVGKRSYSIYLWHYPLLLLMNPVADVRQTPWWLMIVQVAVVVLAAELSYRFIEMPFRKGAFGAWIARLRAGETTVLGTLRRHIIPAALSGAVLLVAAGGVIFVPDTSALSNEGAAILNEADGATQTGGTASSAGTPAADAETDTVDNPFPGAYDITMVGDSVSLRCVDAFPQTFPHGYLDAAKSRQFSAGIEVYRDMVDAGQAGKVAVFALGTNGVVTDAQIDELMGLVGAEREAYFVNTRSPQPWVGATNDALNRAAERYDNASVIDWHGYSEGRNDLFEGDGTHLNLKGVDEYLALIYNAVKGELPAHPEDYVDDAQHAAVTNALNGTAQALSRGLAAHPIGEHEAGSAA